DEERRAREALEPLSQELAASTYPRLEKKQRAAVRAALVALRARFAARRAAWSAHTSAGEWADAEHHARIAEQAEALYSAPGDYFVRDAAMAENVRWLLEREGKGTRMMLWAHNGHVSMTDRFMGRALRRALGRDYAAIGFLFDRGSFQAFDGSPAKAGLKEFTLGPAPAATLEAAFARAGAPLLYVDLRAARGQVKAWLDQAQPSRQAGAVFSTEQAMTAPHEVGKEFDAVIFVDRTTRARPIGRAP
ncbi:MAG TPA: erythromycin esterase family protein, partial [Kofleriaceae bacterium]|nr:erythromycin esterase family protein [Kofleriaceae bacterium]